MVEETFVAPSPREAFELAKEKYGRFSELKLLTAVQTRDEEGRLLSKITVSVSSSDFLESIGYDEEEELSKEIHALKDQISHMKELVSSDTGKKGQLTLDTVREQLFRSGLAGAWLDTLLKKVSHSSIADDAQLLLSYVLDELSDTVQIDTEDLSQKKIMMLIGSTGVGKTTTIAKLAARYAVMSEKPCRVALVNLDTFRVGAYEQLDHYASQMQLTHIKVERVRDFSEVLRQLKGYDIVLVDTAGISPYDTGKLIKTIEFLKSTEGHSIETSLVVSATAKRDDITSIYEHFSFLDISNVILTKFDETKRIGEILDFLMEKSVPVSYISNGQRVPDDLEAASRERLMTRLEKEIYG